MLAFSFGDLDRRGGAAAGGELAPDKRAPRSDTALRTNLIGDVERCDVGGTGVVRFSFVGDGDAFSKRHTRRMMQSTSTATIQTKV